MTTINTQTRLCAVIGNPVGHSMSPAIHNAAFQALGLNYTYLAFNVEDLSAALTGMRALPGFRGMSVTIPHKQDIMAHLDQIEPMAKHVGSVNTVTRTDDGQLIGSTTDGPGTLRAFQEADVPLAGQEITFLGAGGAVRAVAFAMAEANVAKITILGRNLEKVNTLTNDLKAATHIPIFAGTFDQDLETTLKTTKVIIQGTPMGMHPHHIDQSVIPEKMLKKEHVVFDMVYNPHKTKLIKEAQAIGCTTILGLEMLVNQAALQFETWTNNDAPREIMRTALINHLKSQ